MSMKVFYCRRCRKVSHTRPLEQLPRECQCRHPAGQDLVHIKETPKFIVVAQTRESSGLARDWAGQTLIPQGMIEEITEYES